MRRLQGFLNKLSKTRLLPLYIFAGVFFFSLIPQLFLPGFSSSDDPYYHVIHANSYWKNSAMEYPAFSTLSVKPIDLWFLYHILMSPFTAFFDGDNYEALILGSKLYHAILAGILYMVVYFSGKAYAEKLLPARSGRGNTENAYASPRVIGFFSVLALIVIPQSFAVRTLILSRPHVFMIILTMLAMLSIMKKRYFFLFVVSALAPLSYSFSLLILIPSIGILAGWFIVSRKRTDLKDSLIPFGVSILGIALGVWLHPQSANYAFNAWVVHGNSVVAALLHNLIPIERFREYSVPAEFTQTSGIISVGIAYTVLFAGLAVELLLSFVSRKKPGALHTGPLEEKAEIIKTSFVVIGVGFSFLMFFFQRAVEYAAPFLIISGVALICLRFMPKLLEIHARMSARKGEIGDIYRKEVLLVKDIANEKRFRLFFTFLCVFAFVLSPFLINVSILAREHHDLYEYQAAAKYIASQKEKGVVLIPDFGAYPRLIFFGPANRYSSGMDPRFIYMYSGEVGADIDHFTKNEPICGFADCAGKTLKDGYLTLKEYGVSAVFSDSSSSRGAKTFEVAEKDRRFKKTFTDSRYPNINIFSL